MSSACEAEQMEGGGGGGGGRREVADDCSKGIPRLEKGFAPQLHPPTLGLLLTPNPDGPGLISVRICSVLRLHGDLFACVSPSIKDETVTTPF